MSMAIHYEVEEGKSLVIDGPANVIVKTGKVPMIGTGARQAPEQAGQDDVETAANKRKRS
jgi:hypothetical protein